MSALSRTTEANQSPEPEKHNNVALDQTEDEFKPSKLSRMTSLIVDELKKSYNIDPTGEEYTLIIASSLNKGQSFFTIADSTDDQKYVGQEIWGKAMIEKEMMEMKLQEDEIITMAKQKLKDEQKREQDLLKKNS